MLAQDQELIMIKGKRSKRARPVSPLALTMATSSSTTLEFSSGFLTDSSDRVTTSSGEFANFTTDEFEEEEEDMANCLILLARGSSQPLVAPDHRKVPVSTAEIYQCKTCNKSFHSFQALGGHRASHKKPNKPPISPQDEKMIKLVQSDNTTLSLKISSSNGVSGCSVQNKSRVHECSICGAEFASGQALGGHMRRHRPIPVASMAGRGGECQEVKKPRTVLSLDLNLPAPEDESSSKFPFASKEQVIVFSATNSLVDCHF